MLTGLSPTNDSGRTISRASTGFQGGFLVPGHLKNPPLPAWSSFELGAIDSRRRATRPNGDFRGWRQGRDS
jgi:hypothetical protein